MKRSTTYEGPVESPTDPTGATGQLALWLQDLKLSQVPDDVRSRAKFLILDGLGCALVGAKLPWSATAVDVVTRIEGCGSSMLIGWGRTATPSAAALLNGTFIQGFELDDVHPAAPIHSGSVVLPALVACASELADVDGQQFLLGAIAGFEVGPRIGLALGGAEMLSRGWHSGAVFGTHAAAVASGVLLGLDAARFEDALGLAGTQSCGLMGAQFGAMCKRMHHGFASRNGLYSALLAAGGYTGIKSVFELSYGGFLSVFGEGHSPDSSQITSQLGQRWETERIEMKPYAARASLHAPLKALFEILSEHKAAPGEIDHIDVDLPDAAYRLSGWKAVRPLTPVGAQMNVGYALAVAMIDGAAMIQQFSPQRIAADDVWTLIPKITTRHDPSFDDEGAKARGYARVAVHFADGTKVERLKDASPAASQPASGDCVVAKFRTLTDNILNSKRQEKIIEAVLGLEELPSVSTLIDLLAAEVGAAFR